MWTKEFWMDAAERCLGTMAEVAIPLITVALSTEQMDWHHFAYVVCGSGLMCLCKCIYKASRSNENERV